MPDVKGAIAVAGFENWPHGSMTYLLVADHCPKAVVIDPGAHVSPVALHLEAEGLGIELIVLTHEHFDHIAGVEALRGQYQCPVVASHECSRAITDPKLNLSRYLGNRNDIACRPADTFCQDKPVWPWGGTKLQFYPTPGHSPGSICIAVDEYLFTGDTLLAQGKSVTKLPGGNKAELEQSLAFLFSQFGPETVVYPGHGPAFRFNDLGA